MQRVIEDIWSNVRVLPGVIDLNLVALIDRRFPVVCGISIAECRKPDEDA